jgi:hypothetical protein
MGTTLSFAAGIVALAFSVGAVAAPRLGSSTKLRCGSAPAACIFMVAVAARARDQHDWASGGGHAQTPATRRHR